MKTILVTGGAGFIGSNFVNYMFHKYSDYRFLVLDALTYAGNPENIPLSIREDERFEFWYGDVRNAEIVNSLVERSEYVVHFAAETHVARSIYNNRIFYETDVLGTQSLCNAILKSNGKVKRFIHISTSEVYGTALESPMTEGHPLMPCSPYASAKAGADRMVYSYWNTYGIPAITVRPFNNYGPHQHLEKVIPRFITSAILGEELTIHGDGTASRDWLFVDDHCRALDKLIHCAPDEMLGQVFNLGTGLDIDINTLAITILEKMGRPASLIKHIHDRPGQVEKHLSSTFKAEQVLNWKAETSFEEGVVLTIDWYKKNRAWWEPLRWMRQIPINMKDGTRVFH